jgi:hypothetical protein
MKCDICGEDLENAQALQDHVRVRHPADPREDDLEAPDKLGDTPAESSEGDTPKATH